MVSKTVTFQPENDLSTENDKPENMGVQASKDFNKTT